MGPPLRGRPIVVSLPRAPGTELRQPRRRLDVALVELGLAESRSAAAALIEVGKVLVGGSLAMKASRLVGAGEPVRVTGEPPRFVSRGGEKLHAALEHFGVQSAGRQALDAGASTGGFTDCLLQSGAERVVAVDVGRGQLHPRIRSDHRVTPLERTDVRSEALDVYRGRMDVVVADLSFIGLRSVAPALVSFAASGADIIVLVKPQFEAGRAEASRAKGVIRSPDVWRSTLESATASVRGAGVVMMNLMVSPLRGAGGNVEFLSHFRASERRYPQLRSDIGGAEEPAGPIEVLVDRAVEAALQACQGAQGADSLGSGRAFRGGR